MAIRSSRTIFLGRGPESPDRQCASGTRVQRMEDRPFPGWGVVDCQKKGMETACQVTQGAVEVLAEGGIFSSRGQSSLAEMDRVLRDASHALNPGTTADLRAASIFLALLETHEPMGILP